MLRYSKKSITTVLLVLMGVLSQGQTFQNVSSQLGVNAPVTYSVMGAGMSFYDFNDDGWDDLSFAQTNASPIFYENINGSFSPVDFGIPNDGEIKHLTWVDFDNDGDPDIFYTMKDGPCRLFENDGSFNFTDISAGSGFPDDNTHHVNGVCWGDYDKDGLLDVYLCHFNDQYYPIQYSNWLMHNLGNGVFENVTDIAGVGNGFSRSFQSSFVDYNGDTWPDIYVINDRYIYPNALFKNNGDGTFEDVSVSSNSGVILDAMSSSWADYDNDEDLDGYITNGIQGNALLNNDNGIFSDSTSVANLFVNGVCWAANWADFDNDGWQDVYVCTMDNGEFQTYNFAYKNEGNGAFTPVSFGSFPDDVFQSWANVSGDINNDGYVDLVSSVNLAFNTPIWLNDAIAGNNYIKVETEGTTSNKDGIGAWIKVYAGNSVYSRYTACGEDYLCQDSQREIIGLGSANLVDSLVVLWPTGHTDILYNIDVNQSLLVVEGMTMDTSISSDSPPDICEGNSVTLTAAAGYTYSWNTGDTGSSLVVTNSGDYQVTVTDEWGVSATSNLVSITVNPNSTWYLDNDSDGYGSTSVFVTDCVQPANYVAVSGDCDDSNDSVYPGAVGTAQNVDNNCDGVIDQQETNCPGDFNHDLIINTADLLLFLAEIGCTVNCTVDMTGDGWVNTADLLEFLSNFSNTCP